MSPTIPFPHIYRLHYFLCGQTSKRRKRCPELLSRKPPEAEGGAAWSCPPLSFSRLISLHLSIHLTKMLFHSKKARNIPQFPQNITLPSNKHYFAFVWRGFLQTFSSAFLEYTTVFVDFFHTEGIRLSNPTKFSGLLVLVSLKPHLS